MNFTYQERYDSAVAACKEWLTTPWGLHYSEMLKYLPDSDGEEIRIMLQKAIHQSVSHRPNELITTAEVNRQYCNLLDSHKLDIYEKRMEMFKAAALAAEEVATEAKKERAAVAAIISKAEEQAAFQQSIADRVAEDAANKKIPIKELRRAALFGKDRVNGHLTTTAMPASVKHLYRKPTE